MRNMCTCPEGECKGEVAGIDRPLCRIAYRTACDMGSNAVYKQPKKPPPEAYEITNKKTAP